MPYTVERPSPAPAASPAGFVVKNGSKTRLQRRLVDPGARVGDGELDERAGAASRRGARRTPRRARRCAVDDREPCRRRHRLAGVGHEVRRARARARPDRPSRAEHGARGSSTSSSPSQPAHVASPATTRVQVERRLAQHLAPAEGEQVPRQLGGAVGRVARSARRACGARRPRRASATISSLWPSTAVSRLLKSCAIPPASWPTASMRWAARSRSSSRRCSVTSRRIPETPTMRALLVVQRRERHGDLERRAVLAHARAPRSARSRVAAVASARASRSDSLLACRARRGSRSGCPTASSAVQPKIALGGGVPVGDAAPRGRSAMIASSEPSHERGEVVRRGARSRRCSRRAASRGGRGSAAARAAAATATTGSPIRPCAHATRTSAARRRSTPRRAAAGGGVPSASLGAAGSPSGQRRRVQRRGAEEAVHQQPAAVDPAAA